MAFEKAFVNLVNRRICIRMAFRQRFYFASVY